MKGARMLPTRPQIDAIPKPIFLNADWKKKINVTDRTIPLALVKLGLELLVQ